MGMKFEQPFESESGGVIRAHSTASCDTVTVEADDPDPPDNGNGDDPDPPDNGNGDDPEPPSDSILDRVPGGAAGAVAGGVGVGLLLNQLTGDE